MSTGLVEITKDMATAWLRATTHQRTSRKGAIEKYRQDMENGNWDYEIAPPIVIHAPSGAVLNGCHRLKARLQLANGAPWYSEIEYRDDYKSIEKMDTGVRRSLSDTLAIMGYKNASVLQATFNIAANWIHPDAGRFTRTFEIAAIQGNPKIEAAAAWAKSQTGGSPFASLIQVGVLANLWDRAHYAEGPEVVESFATELRSGEWTTEIVRRYARQMIEYKNPKSRSTINTRQWSYLAARAYVGFATEDAPKALYARRSSVYLLPGFHVWADTAYPSLVKKGETP